MITYTFVIPTLNEARFLPRLLTSIEALDKDDFAGGVECIVVDAGSTDETLSIASDFGCRVVRSARGNISKSRNAGARVARGNVLAFIDADCELPSNWLVEVGKQLANHEVVAVGMSMALADEPALVEKTWFELAHANHSDERVKSVQWLPAFNIAVKKHVFNSIDGFDESLETCEDYELGERLLIFGTLRRLESKVGVVHNGESKTVSEFFCREAWHARGEVTLLQKNRSDVKCVLSFLLPIVVVSGVVYALLVAILYGVLGGINNYQLTTIFMVGVVPTFLLVLRRGVAIRYWAQSWVLLNIYFVSRVLGVGFSFQRVDRSKDVEDVGLVESRSSW